MALRTPGRDMLRNVYCLWVSAKRPATPLRTSKILKCLGKQAGFTRRMVVLGMACLSLPASVVRAQNNQRFAAELELFLQGSPLESGGLVVEMPEAVESGYTVPISVKSARADVITSIRVLAQANPLVRIASLEIGRMARPASISFRIRLARSQEVTVLARTQTGRVFRDDRRVEVVVGGCGFDLPVAP